MGGCGDDGCRDDDETVSKPSVFLSAEWRKLAMANYEVPPSVLEPLVPHGTELDFWQGACYASLVGFMFLNTRLKGIPIPFHVNFEEVNLRFYVRVRDEQGWKRGVVFVKEIVPKPALAWVANTIYQEHYEAMPMKHRWQLDADQHTVHYAWRKKSRWNSFQVTTPAAAIAVEPGSEEEFITEHYWGYTGGTGRPTLEYGVEHPRWQAARASAYEVDVDFGLLYGESFSFLTRAVPKSVFVAEGSDVIIRSGQKFVPRQARA